MSAAKPGRKSASKKLASRQPVQSELFSVPEPEACDCPSCSGEEQDIGELIDAIVADAAGVVNLEDPLLAETVAAMFVALAQLEEGLDEALADGLVPQLEARAGAEALALLLAFGSITEGVAAKASAAAAARLADAGVPRPAWAAELAEPLTAGDCWRLVDQTGSASLLACAFHRAGRSHAFLISVDHTDCGAASEIFLMDGEELPGALEAMRAGNGPNGVALEQEALDPADFRWHVEDALDARDMHDEEDPFAGIELALAGDPEDGPPYAVFAVLARSRMSVLPVPSKEKLPHGDCDLGTGVAELRAASDGPAPVYQLKVSLRGAKPPIWRRLEVPADISLSKLHTVLQLAFEWDSAHLHVFQTPYGDFGIPDPELGTSPGESATLEQVAGLKDKISYLYDFGDGWEHEILVEKLLDSERGRTPRCTGGRRAAPPEDCGGLWGYADLLEALADPEHEDHEDMLEWLGLDNAAEFDPAAFDPKAVNEALSKLVSV